MKTPILVFNSRIPKWLSIFITIEAITLWPFVFFRHSKDHYGPVTILHESIHIKQQQELLVIGFYILYGFYWLKALVWNRASPQQAYYMLPFEQEAYIKEREGNYLNERKLFAWWGFRGAPPPDIS